jgi:hypothetical protein
MGLLSTRQLDVQPLVAIKFDDKFSLIEAALYRHATKERGHDQHGHQQRYRFLPGSGSEVASANVYLCVFVSH